MKEILSITELAKLRDVSTETLRHYDRIGLLKPYKIKESTKERYYSIHQFEQLGTIIELKQLGLTLKEIQDYFKNRNVKTTYDLLSKGLDVVELKIEELNKVKKSINLKLNFLEQIKDSEFDYHIEIKEVQFDRYYLISENEIKNEVDLSYEAVKLESIISEFEPYSPIFASNRYAGVYYDYKEGNNVFPKLGIEIETTSHRFSKFKKVSKGQFLCIKYQGKFLDGGYNIQKLINYAKINNLSLDTEILQKQWLDYTFVDNKDELIFEIQIRLV